MLDAGNATVNRISRRPASLSFQYDSYANSDTVCCLTYRLLWVAGTHMTS